MYKLFNILDFNSDLFIIDNLIYNEPININNSDNKFLSCAEFNNVVDFYDLDDGSNRQKWIIINDINDKNIFYIKCAFNRYNYTQYLGCPNKDGIVYLYTSQNNFTKWSITCIENKNYSIKYIGDKFNKNEIELVVARYNENIQWVLAYNDIATIYNKGNKINLLFNNIVNLDNIGREGHTYLYHIINKIDNISNQTTFCQGDPFEHNETILYGIDNYIYFDAVQPLGLRYLKIYNIPPIYIENKFKMRTKYGLEYLIINVDKNHNYLKPNFFNDLGVKNVINQYNERFPHCKSLFENFLNRSQFPITKHLDVVRFTFCGLFSVSKKNVLKYDINVYKNLLAELISYNLQGGENGYILERLWLYIFEN